MRTSDIFVTTAAKLNESIEKVFGKKINLESFDLEQLQDARNKLRTQVSQVRSESSFNETVENDAFTQAQWMLDAINAEIMQRESIANEMEDQGNPYQEADNDVHSDPDPSEYDREGEMAQGQLSTGEEAAAELKSILDSDEDLPEWVQSKITMAVDYLDTARDYMKGQHKKGVAPINNESIEQTGDDMRNLNEGEIQQASAIVTAKTMVDRVGRWIEELSGMENDTLLTLGDSIRDEMGAEQAKTFISSCAPAIQAALENLKATREALSTSVRALTGEEQATDMLGGEPAGDAGTDELGGDEFGGEAEPDAMNAELPPEDEFGAADPAVGGAETAGREKRESIERQNSLLKVLAG
jgi:cell division protein FtsB